VDASGNWVFYVSSNGPIHDSPVLNSWETSRFEDIKIASPSTGVTPMKTLLFNFKVCSGVFVSICTSQFKMELEPSADDKNTWLKPQFVSLFKSVFQNSDMIRFCPLFRVDTSCPF
jgi:hypothetical protein